MNDMATTADIASFGDLVRSPLAWAADCQAQAGIDPEPEAQAAFKQLAEEFENAASEIDGLVSTFDALIHRKKR